MVDGITIEIRGEHLSDEFTDEYRDTRDTVAERLETISDSVDGVDGRAEATAYAIYETSKAINQQDFAEFCDEQGVGPAEIVDALDIDIGEDAETEEEQSDDGQQAADSSDADRTASGKFDLREHTKIEDD